ncbi:hypothetical protein CERZMDRAFT_82338 [Cercospora zeae-maydis SCOH1-5]|uniref:PAZ domain-containing protein n=1 Tax=Cercospora zeae-maydis SCOH1-5 TaxID=717836 RepID=A0A6A6FQ31_9PEZI|nr:hypothetical protein CERZMDRAFT_82338 [Cercospora zeae-maydis SCOH1-5]
MSDPTHSDASQASNNIKVTEIKINSSGTKLFAPTKVGIKDEYFYCSVAVRKDRVPYALQSDTDKKLIESMDGGRKASQRLRTRPLRCCEQIQLLGQSGERRSKCRRRGKIEAARLDQALNESAWISKNFAPSEEEPIISPWQLTTDNGPTTLPIDNERRKEILVAILEKEYMGRPDVAVYANKFLDTKNEPATKVPGLRLKGGMERRLAPISGNTPLLYESACSQLFFKQQQTVASFMLECFGDGKKLDSDIIRNVDLLNKALRGKHVEFQGLDDWQTRPVENVHSILVKDIDEKAKHPTWSGPEGHALRETDLPCINVGTAQYARMMPPEHCFFTPGQTFSKPITEKIRKKLDAHQKTLQTEVGLADLKQIAYAIGGGNVKSVAKALRKRVLEDVLQRAFDKNVKVCFVRSTNNSPPEDVLEEFQKCVVNIPVARMQRNSVWKLVKPLELESASGWTAELKKLKDDHAGPGQTLVAVVLLGKGDNKAVAYQNLKRIVDVDVGVQAYFLTTKHLEKRALGSAQDAAQGATGELVRRMATRHLVNRPVSTEATGLEIGIHIEEVALRNEPPSGYLVVITAKHALSSSGYSTSRELITIIRSGNIIEQNHGDSGKIRDAVQAHMSPARQFSYLVLDDAAPDTLVCQKDVAGLSDPGTILLTDAGVRSDRVTRFFRVHRAQLPKKSDDTNQDYTTLRTTAIGMILTGHRLDGTDFAVKPIESRQFGHGRKMPHRRSQAISPENEAIDIVPVKNTSPSSKPLAERRSPSNPESMRNVSGESGQDESPLPSIGNAIPIRPRQGHLRKSHIGVLPEVFRDLEHTQAPQKQEPVTRAEMERLGHLWTDDLLDLNDQKYPVVTHLAHLVAKRANLHIKLEEGNPVLPSVHAEVAESLYFM